MQRRWTSCRSLERLWHDQDGPPSIIRPWLHTLTVLHFYHHITQFSIIFPDVSNGWSLPTILAEALSTLYASHRRWKEPVRDSTCALLAWEKKFQKQGLFQVRVQEHTATASSVANVRNVLVYLLLQPFASGPVFGSSTVLPGSPRFYRFLAGCKLHPVTHSFPRVNKWWLPAMTQCSAWLPKLVVTSNSVYHLVADVCKIPTFLVQTPLSVKS